MTEQDRINIILGSLPFLIPIIQFLLQKYFGRKKEGAEYGSELLQIANDATEQLRKARDDLNNTEERYENVIKTIRSESDASLASLRAELEAKNISMKNRIAELERVTKIYSIKFDLVTHPNVELKNVEIKAMDDVSASQKLKAITPEMGKK